MGKRTTADAGTGATTATFTGSLIGGASLVARATVVTVAESCISVSYSSDLASLRSRLHAQVHRRA